MGFRPKKSDKKAISIDLSEDVDTIAGHRRKGIPITPKQLKILEDAGRITDFTNAQLRELAYTAAREKAMKSYEGDIATRDGYYTELFNYFYDTAYSQIAQGKSVFLTVPDPIPKEWKRLGEYRQTREKENFKPDYMKKPEGKFAAPAPKTSLDFEIERQLAEKIA